MKTEMQKIHARIYNHLMKQGKPAVVIDLGMPSCQYRTKDAAPLMCAAGCLITDEAYTPEIEGKRACDMGVREVFFQSGIPVDDQVFELIEMWQDAHDRFARNEEHLSHWPHHIAATASKIEQHLHLNPIGAQA